MSELSRYNPNILERTRLFLGGIAAARSFRDENGRRPSMRRRIRIAKRFEELRKTVGNEQNEGEYND